MNKKRFLINISIYWIISALIVSGAILNEKVPTIIKIELVILGGVTLPIITGDKYLKP